MSNNTVPVLAAVVLGALALSPVLSKVCSDPQVAAIGSRQLAGNSAISMPKAVKLAKVGYSLGYMMGQNVKKTPKTSILLISIKGINDGFNGKESTMTREEMIKSGTNL